MLNPLILRVFLTSYKFHQISLKDTFSECQDLFIDDTPSFFQLLDHHLDLDFFIPDTFFKAFYRSLGHPTNSLLTLFLNLSEELRHFYGFHQVLKASLFTHFKQDFLPFIEAMFH